MMAKASNYDVSKTKETWDAGDGVHVTPNESW